ncbi:class I SAM-dependent RNA methyltransferase [Rhodophyticola sp. CCM32]|uniref:class I SAM-dependent RNA methyltransferase n=1 Tax=Rhodophyticola sp. CCM32 TaxID=2916397 RepID=UPI00107F7CF8|nr:class I SAM-dependent RNA methyltransferase [Rhodophyticola sp. CCM32]QBY02001.1 class I SAM-dependent RNA methyltransferase [Rhodophyticola sp. CCM32]
MSLKIARLGHQGDGIAPGPIFVPLTLPGEEVEGEIIGGRVEDARILTPSTDRISAPCRHFRNCGGCSLQHATDAFLEDWKQDVLRMALAGQGLEAPFRPIHVSPSRSRRRASLAGTRTKKGALIGFHARKSEMIVPISDCLVLHPELLAALPALQQMTRLGGSRSAVLSFALTRSEAGLDCMVTGGKPLDAGLRMALPHYADHFARLTWGDETVFTVSPPVQRFGPAQVTPPPGAFLQATAEGEAALLAAVQEVVGGADAILDLFAGCGTFTLPLARNGAVHAVEGDAGMIAALDHGRRHASGIKPVTSETRDLFRRPLLPDELRRFDAVVIDPPRAGAEAQMAELAKAQVPRIAMVSCNPVSFARDAKTLVDAGYHLNWVQVVDQFRWSPHVELAASLTLPHIGTKPAKGQG